MVSANINAYSSIKDNILSYQLLLEDNIKLKKKNRLLQFSQLKMQAYKAENRELRNLIKSPMALKKEVSGAEILLLDRNNYNHQLIINKGKNFNIKEGLAILDSRGILGQIVHVGYKTSRVLLITDKSHSIPVQVTRNGARAIAVGNGDISSLDLLYVPIETDIKENDLLISSGLGSKFPFGYPVAVVKKVSYKQEEPFLSIQATPIPHIQSSRHILIIQDKNE